MLIEYDEGLWLPGGLERYRSRYRLADQTVWHGTGDADGQIAPDRRLRRPRRKREVNCLVLRGAANDLTAGLIVALHHHLNRLSQVASIVFALDLALPIVKNAQALRL